MPRSMQPASGLAGGWPLALALVAGQVLPPGSGLGTAAVLPQGPPEAGTPEIGWSEAQRAPSGGLEADRTLAPILPGRPLLGGPPPLDLASPTEQDLTDQATLEARSQVVEWSASGARGWDAISSRQTVRAGDRVRTGARGSGRLVYFEGSVTELSADTSIIVQRLERSSGGNIITSLFQSAGATLSRVGRMVDPGASFEIETPAATAFVRGTTPRVTVARDGSSTRVENIPDGSGGLVIVRGSDPAGTTLTLQPNEGTTILRGQAPQPPTPLQSQGGTAPPPLSAPAVILPPAGARVVSATIPVPPPATVPPVVGPGTVALVPPTDGATAAVTADLGSGARATLLLRGEPGRALAVRVAAQRAPDDAPAAGPPPLALAVDVYDASSGAAVSTPLLLGIVAPRGFDPSRVVVTSAVSGTEQVLSGTVDPASGVLHVPFSS
jgi:hypothetical protein